MDLFGRQVSAVTVVTRALGSILLKSFKTLLGAEASVGLALLNELLGIRLIHRKSLALDVRAVFAADIRSFVVLKTCELHRVIYNLSCSLNITFTVGIFDPQYESAAFVLSRKILVKRGAEITDMHKSRGTGSESRSYFHT